MADVIVLNGDGEEEHFTGVEAVELTSEEEGQTEVFKKLPEVTAEDNGKVLGVVEGAWAKMNAPKTYTHPDTHPVSMITGLSDIAKTGTYEDLQNKPFGAIFVVHAGEYTFEEIDGVSGCYGGYLPIRDEITVGKTYIVSWDGVAYSCVAKDAGSINASLSSLQGTYLGNSTKLFTMGLGDDTGEPFIIFSNMGNGTVSAMTDDTSEAHAISVRPKDNIRKIDKQYLPDGLATEEYVKDAISNIEASGGGSVGTETETDILPKQTIVFPADSSGELALEPPISFAVGHTYIVEFDNVEYTCEAALVSDSTTSATVVGNKGFVGGEVTSEPFIILTGVLDGEPRTLIVLSEITDAEESHTIRIYQTSKSGDASISWENVTDRPFGTEREEVALIPETTYEFVYSSDMGGYFVMTEVSEGISSAWGSDWDEAIVIWDGVSYTVKRQDFGGATFVGNGASMGLSSNGEPFILTIFDGQLQIQSLVDGIPEDTTNASTINHTVAVSLITEKVIRIPDEYQTQSDWDETDPNSAACIKNRPFGVEVSSGSVITDCTAQYDSTDFGLQLFNTDTMQSYVANRAMIVEGGMYTLQCGLLVAHGIGISADETYLLANLGNGMTCQNGIKFTDDSGTHVATLVAGFRDVLDFIVFVEDFQPLLTHGELYPVFISVAEDIIKELDRKYLPGPPEFDLTAMGLSSIPLNGTQAMVKTDTTTLRNALDNGVVKVAFTANTGSAVYKLCGIMNALRTGGDEYNGGFVGVFADLPMMLNFTITPAGIAGWIIPLAATTT